MTSRQLKIRLVLLSIFIILYACGMYVAKKIFIDNELYAFLSDIIPLIAILLASYLAYCFQLRSQFLTNLRNLWLSMVCAKNEIMYYLNSKDKTDEKFNYAMKSISYAIDEMRCVYKNIAESKWKKGLFPYEPLKCIVDYFKCTDPSSIDSINLNDITENITCHLDSMKTIFLAEFNPTTPSNPIVIGKNITRRRRLSSDDVEKILHKIN